MFVFSNKKGIYFNILCVWIGGYRGCISGRGSKHLVLAVNLIVYYVLMAFYAQFKATGF